MLMTQRFTFTLNKFMVKLKLFIMVFIGSILKESHVASAPLIILFVESQNIESHPKA